MPFLYFAYISKIKIICKAAAFPVPKSSNPFEIKLNALENQTQNYIHEIKVFNDNFHF